MSEAALAFLRESILHGLVAAGVVLTLLRLWRLRSPRLRLRLLLLALGFPVLVQPLLFWLAPERHGAVFSEDHALFASGRYAALVLLGARADVAMSAFLVTLALVLLLRDLLPLFAERLETPSAAPSDAVLDAQVSETLAGLGGPLRLAAPRVRLVDGEAPDISCTGQRRGEVVVSASLARALEPQELRAALAHELAHLRYGDPLWGWALIGLRVLYFFNPAVQLLARFVVREIEYRADDCAAALVREPSILATALVKTYRRGLGHRRLGSLLEPWRLHALERRCRRLFGPAPGQEIAAETLHLGATAAGLATLLLFVV